MGNVLPTAEAEALRETTSRIQVHVLKRLLPRLARARQGDFANLVWFQNRVSANVEPEDYRGCAVVPPWVIPVPGIAVMPVVISLPFMALMRSLPLVLESAVIPTVPGIVPPIASFGRSGAQPDTDYRGRGKKHCYFPHVYLHISCSLIRSGAVSYPCQCDIFPD